MWFKWTELYLFDKSHRQINLDLKEDIYDNFNYIKIECPVLWYEEVETQHNLLKVLLKELKWIIKKIEQNENCGITISWLEVRWVIIPLNSIVPKLLFIFGITVRLLIWIESAVNLTAEVVFVCLFSVYLNVQFGIYSCSLIFWDLYHYSKFLKTFKIPGLFISMLYVHPHFCYMPNLCALSPHRIH